MEKSAVAMTRFAIVDRRRPPDGGAQPGQQLVHAERLGDVVVGAGVEGGHLVGLALADRQHDDRDVRPTAQAADDLDAVDAGEADVEHDDVGMLLGREHQRLFAGRRQHHLVVARLQVGRHGPQDLRLVVDHQHPCHDTSAPSPPAGLTHGRTASRARRRQADDGGEPAAGGVLEGELAVHGVDEPAGDREAEARRRCRWVGRRAAGTARTAARDRRPAPRTRGRRCGDRPARPRSPASMRTG